MKTTDDNFAQEIHDVIKKHFKLHTNLHEMLGTIEYEKFKVVEAMSELIKEIADKVEEQQ